MSSNLCNLQTTSRFVVGKFVPIQYYRMSFETIRLKAKILLQRFQFQKLLTLLSLYHFFWFSPATFRSRGLESSKLTDDCKFANFSSTFNKLFAQTFQ